MKINHSAVILSVIGGALVLMIWFVMTHSPDSPYVRAGAQSGSAVK